MLQYDSPNLAIKFRGMFHEWPKHLDNLLSLPLDRQIQRCVAMFYGAGSGDPARVVVMLIYPVNHASFANEVR
jgi:hypothetical protein